MLKWIKKRTGVNKILYRYSDTQSFANSFLGYVVLDTFNNVPRDKENILDQC